MADGGGDICASICCGLCCMAGSSALSNWCMLKSYGSGSGTSTGCCGSCCDKSFNDDSFDEQVRKDMEATRDPNAPSLTEQMQPVQKMTAANPEEAMLKDS
ncbi:uncharacterized protein BT62DRAFT_362783 [Guyanagaster necrorhizus]|uniref:Uncharacterized protein n=1 Tax=Guyanagaster necrorhizus TaxID=856835 RepID=A0A9P8APF6_9AGAR|nr:uncharacterized protein BT62DRAFT_362783 [Guyanagaster necrorhizus MCA 3950]KAG7442895.1 hypothetical protein BT62DRAFT_362783 [Guyanagaster necrorhizus MCA 3950]